MEYIAYPVRNSCKCEGVQIQTKNEFSLSKLSP